jgi:transcriptional regulator with XRE-family HTH domain
MKGSMAKEKNINSFGNRLAKLRKERGLTQQQLADKIDVSRRVIAYYEVESDNPPSNIVVLLSKALNVSADHLLGLKPFKDNGDKPSLRLTRRMKKIEALPPSQQKALLKTLDTFLKGAER